MIKKIALTLLSLFLVTPCLANIHINPNTVVAVIKEMVPADKVNVTITSYNTQLKASRVAGGGATQGISANRLWNVCAAAGWDIKKPAGKSECKKFVSAMLKNATVAFVTACDDDKKGKAGNICVDNFFTNKFYGGTQVKMQNAIALSLEYIRVKYNDTQVQCWNKANKRGLDYGVLCVSRDKNASYELIFDDVEETADKTIQASIQSAICRMYGATDCAGANKNTCANINQSMNKFGYTATYTKNKCVIKKKGQKYYAVCGSDKGKTGGAEVCVKGVFNWVNVGRLQALGLMQEYARVRYKDTIECDTVNTRLVDMDDYVKCASKKSKRYYEFQFDDVTESVDQHLIDALVLGICKVHGLRSGIKKVLVGYEGTPDCKSACTDELKKTANVFGLTTQNYSNNTECRFASHSMTAEEAKTKLHQIKGIDSYVFYDETQINGDQNIISQLRDYIKSTGTTVRTFDCDKHPGKIKKGTFQDTDDVLGCTLNGQPIDFVFQDFSEAWLYVREDGEAKIACRVGGGRFAGKKCHIPSSKQCTELNEKFMKQNPKASGFYWDGVACVSRDSEQAEVYDEIIDAGVGMVAVIDCVAGTKLGCAMVLVEAAGLVIEKEAGDIIQDRAGEFLAVSTRCKQRDCAINTIKNAGKVLSVMGALDALSLKSVDEELARLVGYLEPTDLSGVSANDWSSVVTQLGGDPNDASGTALVTLNKIGLVMQFASIGVSGLHLTAKAITKLASKGTRVERVASKFARASDTINYDKKLRAAYKQYAPKNQSFDDFKKMFANEAEFNDAVAGWKTFEPGSVKMGEYLWSSKVYMSSPYSTYDPELAKQMKAIDAEYAGDIAALDEQIKPLKDFRSIERNKTDLLKKQKRSIEDIASERLGRKVTGDDWDLEELSDLKQQYVDLGDVPDYTPQEIEGINKLTELEHMRKGYKIARDFEKSKLINSTIPDEVATAVVETRQQELVDIIASDDVLFAQLQDFENLSIADKQSFLQNVHSKLDDVTHNVGLKFKVGVYEDPKSSIVANAARQYNNSPLGRQLNANEVLNTIVHEQSHLVDKSSPDLGMLGAQKANIDIQKADMTTQWETYWDWNTFAPTEKRYRPIETQEVYRAVPTEYSSHQVGSVKESAPTHQNLVQQIIERRAEMQ